MNQTKILDELDNLFTFYFSCADLAQRHDEVSPESVRRAHKRTLVVLRRLRKRLAQTALPRNAVFDEPLTREERFELDELRREQV